MYLLCLNKALYTSTPFIIKEAINTLTSINPLYGYASTCLFSFAFARTSVVATHEIRNAIGAEMLQNQIKELAQAAFRKLHQLDHNFHLKASKETVYTIHRAFQSFETIIKSLINNFLSLSLDLGIALGILGMYCGPSYLIATMTTLGGYTWFTNWYSQRRRVYFRDYRKAQQQSNTIMQESVQNFEAVRIFNQQESELNRFNAVMKNQARHAAKVIRSLGVLNVGQSAIFNMGLAINLLFALKGIQAGVMTVGDLVLIQTLLFQVAAPLGTLGTVYREVQESMLDVNELVKVLLKQGKIQEQTNAKDIKISKGIIEFQNVTLKLEDKTILDNVSFVIEGGKKTAIVGESGCGKSTLMKLLFRIYDPDQGKILIDGQDIKRVTLKSLTSQIAMVPQNPYLFNDTILQNLKFGKDDASVQEIEEACQKVNIHNKILSFDKQYNQQVGEFGQLLSGGERQRIAIARALLKRSPIYLLDEVTSAMDAENEWQIQKQLDNIKGATLVYNAHRLSSIIDAHQIIVMRTGGKVEEIGTHFDLVQRQGSLYSKLWKKFMKESSEQDDKNNKKDIEIKI